MASSGDLERQPLLRDSSVQNIPQGSSVRSLSSGADRKPNLVERLLARARSTFIGPDSTKYQVASLSTWSTLWRLAGTVWVRKNMRVVLLYLCIISTTTAVLVFVGIKSPDKLQLSKFSKLGTFLNVFVGLILGFFLSSSMNRWYACADGFLQIMDSIRNLQMQLLVMGVPDEDTKDVIRYGLLSVLMLELELKNEALEIEEKHEHATAEWAKLVLNEDNDEFCYMTNEEADALERIDDPGAVIWTWVAAIIARMAQDGVIPPMASPTYGRVMNLAQDAHSGIRVVRTSISIQPAFIYVQLLAALVHFNNIINAIAFGLTTGATAGTTVMSMWPEPGKPRPSIGDVSRDLQNLIVSFFLSCFGPLIYQALLEVAITLSLPFSSADGALPIRAQLNNLQQDLINSFDLFNHLPRKWEKPCFKQKK